MKPASCSTVQKRLLRLEKLWPATCSARARIQAAENHVKAAAEDIWFVSAQVTPPSANALRPMAQSSGGNCPATPPQLSWQEGP